MAFIHYDEQNVTNWKQGEWRFIEYLNGQLVGQYDAIIHNNENMIKLRKNSQPFLLNVKIWLWKTAIVSDEASHNDFWKGEGELGGGEGTAARILSGACACYKRCKILQQGRAAEFQLEALLSELNCYNFWTGLSQWLEGWITREVERGEIIYSEWVAITLSKQKKASQCRVQTIWYNLISFFTTSLRLLLFQNLVGSSCWK